MGVSAALNSAQNSILRKASPTINAPKETEEDLWTLWADFDIGANYLREHVHFGCAYHYTIGTGVAT